MNIDLTTPALLFPAISLLLLAYTNRFLALAALIRKLHDEYKKGGNQLLLAQIANLSARVRLIRLMQELGVFSLLLCVAAMFLIFAKYTMAGEIIFGISLLTLLASLAVSVHEIHISVRALNIQLQDLEKTTRLTTHANS
ncbi:MAG: DUF2721 domain-containing protein [Myxococcales bacterium]|nr:MAG: DUF2721 domain-containing protein [Myxococcales bacterium]